MNTGELRRWLTSVGAPVEDHTDRQAGISSHYLRSRLDGRPLFAVGGERSATTRIDGVVHALHWARHRHPSARRIAVVVGTGVGRSESEVRDAVGTLVAGYCGGLSIDLFFDQQPTAPVAAGLTQAGGRWARLLAQRAASPLPASLASLSAAVGAASFRWYRNLTDERWSGRVDGLEVCSVDAPGRTGCLDVGKDGRRGATSPAREAFLALARSDAGPFALPADEPRVAAALRRLVTARDGGALASVQPEHRLEARVLRGAVPVVVQGLGPLAPVVQDQPFQLPTLWTAKGPARFVDALLRAGPVPWVVELKVATGGQGSYYRHAVAQAVLYRHFVRTAQPIHGWFDAMGLEANSCRAMVAVPAFKGPRADEMRSALVQSAHDFGVSVALLDTP